MKAYSYIFVRQDLTIEQQMVQAAHATMVIGHRMSKEKPFDRMNHNVGTIPFMLEQGPKNTHFVLVGVRSLGALNAVGEILTKFGYLHEKFHEPDIGQDTAICTLPIGEYHRGVLQAFNTLKVK